MRILLFVFALLLTGTSFGQSLKFKVIGQADDTVHLVRYFGKGLYYADTAEIKNGSVTFDGSKQKQGILALMLPGQKLLEFIYDGQDVQIETHLPQLMDSAKVKASEENKIFLNYMRFMSSESKRANALIEKRNGLEEGSDEYKAMNEQIDEISKGVKKYQEDLVKNNQGKLVAKVVHLSMDVEIPESPRDEEGNIIDSAFQYKYFKAHYWDHLDFSDDRLVRTPVFHNKLEAYFSKRYMLQHWDTVIHYAYDLCDRIPRGTDMFQYTVSWITSTYEKSKIMGMDKVFVYMGDKYYCSKDENGESPAFWMKEESLKKLCDKVKTNYNLVMGAVPPNISLRDTTDTKWKDFYSLPNEYTILYFWDPECGHCKKVTPKLATLYDKKFKERDIEIFAVGKAVGEDFEKWKKFIHKHEMHFINVAMTDKLYEQAMKDARQFVPKYTTLESLNYQQTYDIFATPKVFVLDKDKKIIAKGITISQLEDLLDRRQGFEDSEKLFPPEENKDEEQMH
jgi:thiol-disulfide isomerase/thioredoxin